MQENRFLFYEITFYNIYMDFNMQLSFNESMALHYICTYLVINLTIAYMKTFPKDKKDSCATRPATLRKKAFRLAQEKCRLCGKRHGRPRKSPGKPTYPSPKSKFVKRPVIRKPGSG